MQAHTCVTPSAPGSFQAAALLCWFSPMKVPVHPAFRAEMLPLACTAGPERGRSRGLGRAQRRRNIPHQFLDMPGQNQPDKAVLFPASAWLLVLPLQASLAAPNTVNRQDLHSHLFWVPKKGEKKRLWGFSRVAVYFPALAC